MRIEKEPDPDPHLRLMDPDPGGPKHADPVDPDPDPQHCAFKNINSSFFWGPGFPGSVSGSRSQIC
jgi:hypothetical protein